MAKIMITMQVEVAVDLADWQHAYGTTGYADSREDALGHIPATIAEAVADRLSAQANGAKLHAVVNPVTMPFAGQFAEGDRVRSTLTTTTGTVLGHSGTPGWYHVREDDPQVHHPTGYATWYGLAMTPLED